MSEAKDLPPAITQAGTKENGMEERMTFGEAIEVLNNGGTVRRLGWNGKGMYLWLLPAAEVPAEWCKEPRLKKIAEENGGKATCLASIRMRTADGAILTGWLASQSDILATDWQRAE